MSEKKLYRVRFVYDDVAVGSDGRTARTAFYRALQGEHPPDTCEEMVTPITHLDQLPYGWSGESLPYGDTTERKIVDWLVATKGVVVRGEPTQVETFLASMRGVAARMGVEILDAPDTEET